VRRLSPHLLAESKANQQTIPLSLLRQEHPPEHKVGPGDVLGVFIETVLGERGQPPPVRISEFTKQPPSIGFPIPVRGNGTIPLPLVEPLQADGMTLEEVEKAIRKAYMNILKTGREAIIVTLQRPRDYHVLVIRQDSAGVPEVPTGGGVTGARTTGFLLTFGAGTTGARRGMGY